MSAGFTPGPWSLPHFAKPEVGCECGYVLTDHLMGAVATVHVSGEGGDWQSHGDNPRFEEACANARLIAAAPDLYEALRDALSCIEPDVFPHAYTQGLAALAKATSKTEAGA